jgi:hypothetical protein
MPIIQERENNSMMHRMQNEAINDSQVVILVVSYLNFEY